MYFIFASLLFTGGCTEQQAFVLFLCAAWQTHFVSSIFYTHCILLLPFSSNVGTVGHGRTSQGGRRGGGGGRGWDRRARWTGPPAPFNFSSWRSHPPASPGHCLRLLSLFPNPPTSPPSSLSSCGVRPEQTSHVACTFPPSLPSLNMPLSPRGTLPASVSMKRPGHFSHHKYRKWTGPLYALALILLTWDRHGALHMHCLYTHVCPTPSTISHTPFYMTLLGMWACTSKLTTLLHFGRQEGHKGYTFSHHFCMHTHTHTHYTTTTKLSCKRRDRDWVWWWHCLAFLCLPLHAGR